MDATEPALLRCCNISKTRNSRCLLFTKVDRSPYCDACIFSIVLQRSFLITTNTFHSLSLRWSALKFTPPKKLEAFCLEPSCLVVAQMAILYPQQSKDLVSNEKASENSALVMMALKMMTMMMVIMTMMVMMMMVLTMMALES